MDCSNETAAAVDAAVQKLLKQCYDEAVQMLNDNRALLDEIAEYLLAKETISGEELMNFVRPAAAEEVAAAEGSANAETADETVTEAPAAEISETEENETTEEA